MIKCWLKAMTTTGLALLVATGLCTAAIAAPLTAPLPGTYQFSGVCMDCLRDGDGVPLPTASPATATLVVRPDPGLALHPDYTTTFDFNYRSALWEIVFSDAFTSTGIAQMGLIDPDSGFADAFIHFQAYGDSPVYGRVYVGWDFISDGSTGAWELRQTEFRTEDFGTTGIWRTAAVPEPGTLLLLALALASCALARRREGGEPVRAHRRSARRD